MCLIADVTEEGRRSVSFHHFSYTFITDPLVKGVSPILVGRPVGRKEPHVQRRYAHLCCSPFRDEFAGSDR